MRLISSGSNICDVQKNAFSFLSNIDVSSDKSKLYNNAKITIFVVINAMKTLAAVQVNQTVKVIKFIIVLVNRSTHCQI